jgi:putative membrane protein
VNVSLFTTQAKEGQDAALKAFASKILPTLQEHLHMVRALAAQQPGEHAQQQRSEGMHKP